MIIEILKITVLLAAIGIVLRGIHIQHLARKHILKKEGYTAIDKLIINTRELPPEEYLSEEGIKQKNIVLIYSIVGLFFFVIWGLLEHFL